MEDIINKNLKNNVMIEINYPQHDAKLSDICQRYWEIDKDGKFQEDVIDIANDYEITVPEVTKLIKNHSVAYSAKIKCIGKACDGKQYVFQTRTDFIRTIESLNVYICEKCRRENRKIQLLEKTYKNEASIISIKESALDNNENQEMEIIDPEKLSFREFLYLLSLIKHSGIEGYEMNSNINILDEKLAPTNKYSVQILETLLAGKLIDVDWKNNPENFGLQRKEINPHKGLDFTWKLMISETELARTNFIEKLESMVDKKNWPSSWEEESRILTHEVAVQICLEYLFNGMQIRYFESFGDQERAQEVIEFGLECYSISQMFNLINQCYRKISDKIVLREKTLWDAPYSLIGLLRYRIKGATNKDWAISNSMHKIEYSEAAISNVLFQSILQLTNQGLEEVFAS